MQKQGVQLGILAMLVGGSGALFSIALKATDDPVQMLGIFVVVSLIGLIVRLVVGVYMRVEPEIIEGAADGILDWMERGEDKEFYKQYAEYLYFRHRTFDMKGLSTQGPFNLELEHVFVDLIISPESQFDAGVVIPGELHKGGHNIWKYLEAEGMRNLAIIGSPGCGKTTLVKYITIVLAERKQKIAMSHRLPILLFLRDHAETIAETASVALPVLINRSLTHMQDRPPKGWFEEHLKAGRCLIMVDGLDEVGDPLVRQQVVTWVERQMEVYGNSRFIITSRPHGYHSNPLSGVNLLEVQHFNQKQVEQFVRNWYLANEIASYQKKDPGVIMEAEEGADDLLRRIRTTPDIAELAVNPLLLTMIANVHRFRSSLPGRRVELYAEMCEVFLGKRQQARGMLLDLTPAQQRSVLQPLALYMMGKGLRELKREMALSVIEEPLRQVSLNIEEEAFLKMVQDRSGILIEKESGVYGFAHKTFQEYLAAVHVLEKGWISSIVRHVNDAYWHETIRLYCAQTDATPIIQACLAKDPPPIPALVLAIACNEEARSVDPMVRKQLEHILIRDLESEDNQRRRIVAEARLELRLRRLARLEDNLYVDTTPLTQSEYQLFIDQSERGLDIVPHHWENTRFATGQGRVPIVGVTPDMVNVFFEWLNKRQIGSEWFYRLPKMGELDKVGPYWVIGQGNLTNQIMLAEPHPITCTLQEWVIAEDGVIIGNDLAPRVVHMSYFGLEMLGRLQSAYEQALVHFSIRARDRARTLRRENALKLPLGLIKEPKGANILDGTRKLALPLANALTQASELERNPYLASTLARASELTISFARARTIAPAFTRICDLTRTLDVAHRYSAVHPWLSLYKQVAHLMAGHIFAAMIKIREKNQDTISRLLSTLKAEKMLDNFRRFILEEIIWVTENGTEQRGWWNTGEKRMEWDSLVDELATFYAYLALVERRRRGDMDAFEAIWIVREQRGQNSG